MRTAAIAFAAAAGIGAADALVVGLGANTVARANANMAVGLIYSTTTGAPRAANPRALSGCDCGRSLRAAHCGRGNASCSLTRPIASASASGRQTLVGSCQGT